jgi:hypothetical protein
LGCVDLLFLVLQVSQSKYKTEFYHPLATGKKVRLLYFMKFPCQYNLLVLKQINLSLFAPFDCSLKYERGIYQEGLFFTRPGKLFWERNPLESSFSISSNSPKHEEAMSMY